MEILKAIWDIFGLGTVYIVFALIVVLCISMQTFRGKRKAKKGDDRARIHKILATVMENNSYYIPVFATGIVAGRNCTKYYFYAVALQEERMVMVPLSFADKVMGYGTPFEIRKEQLQKIGKFKKNPEAKRQVFYFTDKTPKKLFDLELNAVQLSIFKKTEPVNMFQEEEVLAFSKIMFRWSDELARENQ